MATSAVTHNHKRSHSRAKVAATVVTVILSLLGFASPAAAAGGKTVPAAVNIRQSATTSSKVVGSIPANTNVTFTCFTSGQTITDYWGGRNSGWHKVTYNGKTGYIADGMVNTGVNGRLSGEPLCSSTTTSSKPGGKTVPMAVNIRQSATTSSKVVGSIPANTNVTFTCFTSGQTITDYWGGRNSGWHKVTYNGKTGYVADGVVSTGANGRLSGEPTCSTSGSTASGGTTTSSTTAKTCSGRARGDHSCLAFSGFDKWADRYENTRVSYTSTNAYGAYLDPYGHNCVGYVAYRLKERGVPSFAAVNANSLHISNTRSKGWYSSSNPTVGALAQHGRGTWGHVAYVEAVYSNGRILISESNWGGRDGVRVTTTGEFDRFLTYQGRGSDVVEPVEPSTVVQDVPVAPTTTTTVPAVPATTPSTTTTSPAPVAPATTPVSGASIGAQLSQSEFRGATGVDGSIVRLYAAVFVRIPDQSGFNYWAGTGIGVTDMATNFVASEEFTVTYGSLNDEQFVDLVYRNVLGRSADAGGAAYWTGLLASGHVRADVVLGFSESAEFRAQTGTN